MARFGGETRLEEPGDTLWVLAGPERPFCGGYARRLVEKLPDEGRLLLVGESLLEVLTPTSPVRARRLAAEAARHGADHKLAELGQDSRVLRQEAVAGELLELFAGRLTEAN